jgi:hypothetical protein
MKPAKRQRIYRSKWEEEYSTQLKLRKAAGEILSWSYESIRLRVAESNWYTPDFLIVTEDEIQLHEVKGFQREAGMLRLRAAAFQHRAFRFFLVTKKAGQWLVEEVK